MLKTLKLNHLVIKQVFIDEDNIIDHISNIKVIDIKVSAIIAKSKNGNLIKFFLAKSQSFA